MKYEIYVECWWGFLFASTSILWGEASVGVLEVKHGGALCCCRFTANEQSKGADEELAGVL